jgi:hypothetical protein
MVENARFFTQKRTFLHIFAGGRDDFLAGPKTPFFGILGSRERPRPRPNFAPCANPKIARFTYEAHFIGYKKNNFIFLYPPFT